MAGAHLTFGGSAAHRWLACPGSVTLCATLPPQRESEAMAEGTRAHALLEHCLREREDDALGYEGMNLQPGWPVYTQEDVEAVQLALDHINDIFDNHSDAVVHIEYHARLSEDMGGTSDVVIWLPTPRVLVVIDYKHGRGKFVNVEQNPQAKLYAVSVLKQMPDLRPVAVETTIVQPRCPAGAPIRTASYSPAALMWFEDEVAEAVARAKLPNWQDHLVPGEQQCNWCPAAAVCPALTASVAEGAEYLVADVPSGETITVTFPKPGDMRTPVGLATALSIVPVLETWADAIKATAEAAAQSGVEIPGYKLVDKRALRKWADEEGLLAWAAKQGLTLQEPKTLSPAQAEKVVKAKLKTEGVAAMSAFVIKESSGTKLVAASAAGDPVDPVRVAASSFGAAQPL
jgi:Protein of unknown function (DUF2800)